MRVALAVGLSSSAFRIYNVTDDLVVPSSARGSGAGRVTSVDTVRSTTPRAVLRALSLPVASSALTSYQTSSVSGKIGRASCRDRVERPVSGADGDEHDER